jgi:transcriptional regulator GlxA family with amidase domain
MLRKQFLLMVSACAMLSACKQQKNDSNLKQETHESLMAQFPPPTKQIRTVGILVYDGYTTLDAMGPYQMFSELMGTEVFFIAKNKGQVKNMTNMVMQVDTSIAEVNKLDILVIPGGLRETYSITKDTAIINWIKQIDKTTQYTTSVCTGAWILGATGLLRGREATTHWYGKQILKDKFGAIIVDKRYAVSDKYWTSAGVTAGMDMSLAIIREIRGDKYTQAAMLDMEYDPKPPIKAGSEFNTDKDVVQLMRTMYDAGMRDVLK